VRSRDDVGAAKRLRDAVAFHVPDLLDAVEEHVVVVDSDLAVEESVEPIAAASVGSIGLVLHAAADIRHFGRLEDFERINVGGTRRLIDLSRHNGWRFAFISTLSVVGSAPSDPIRLVFTERDFDRGQVIDNPYCLSKFRAEREVRRAMSCGLRATVHRVGSLVGESRQGRFLPNPDRNMLYRTLRAIMRCGAAPNVSTWEVDLTPVDYAASAILELSMDPLLSGRTFHICNPKSLSLSDLVETLRTLGYGIALADPMALYAWLDREKALPQERDALEALVPLFETMATERSVTYDSMATLQLLGDLVCPTPDASLVKTIVGYGIDTAYFPPPSAWGLATPGSSSVMRFTKQSEKSPVDMTLRGHGNHATAF
jgi:thioester reductase-like protein